MLILNIFCVAKLDEYEIISIRLCDIFEVLIYIILILEILLISKILDVNLKNISKRKKIILLIVVFIIYTLLQVAWINIRKATPIYDSEHVYVIAKSMYENKLSGLNSWYLNYMERYPQQISLAFFWSVIFKIFNSTSVLPIQYINALANTLTLFGLLLITKQLEKTYNVNKYRTFFVFLAFLTLPLLANFVYGDIMSITLCVFSVYFIMKYVESKKDLWAIITSIFTAIANIIRMNNLIYFIAIIIYLILDILKPSEKNYLKKIIILVVFIIISLLPTSLVKMKFQNELNLDREATFPVYGFLYMGMEDDSARGYGWYDNGIASLGLNSPKDSKADYKNSILRRLKYLLYNPLETLKFYTKKNASMWAENTYSANYYNLSCRFGSFAKEHSFRNNENVTKYLDDIVYDSSTIICLLQKSIVVLIFAHAMGVLIKYRKNIASEVLLLVIIFMGGFFFHILWEAKSRYIIMYIVILMPLVSINISRFSNIKVKEIIKSFNKED